MLEAHSIWKQVLGQVQEIINKSSFETWLNPTTGLELTETELSIKVPNKFFTNWLKEHYYDILTEQLEKIVGKKLNIVFIAIPPDKKTLESVLSSPTNKEKSTKPEKRNIELAQLNPKYKFEYFVIGKSNQFAHAASLAVAKNLANAYNPLFIYGGVGLGKTHLMQAIGYYIQTNSISSKICYVSAENFMNEMIYAIQNNTNSKFRNKYRNIDLLLIDDIQFLAGKSSTQEEFFHTFNTLYDANKQIVLTSDRPPNEIATLSERLSTRFNSGLTVDIQPPDLETRMAILHKKCERENNPNLPQDVILFLASSIRNNIRDLEGALIRLIAYLSITNEEPTVELAQNVLKDHIKIKVRPISSEDIQKIVSDEFGITIKDLHSTKRSASIVLPRQIAMYLIREITGKSFNEIGKKFGNRDHTTIIHACKKIKRKIEEDINFKLRIERIKQQLGTL